MPLIQVPTSLESFLTIVRNLPTSTGPEQARHLVAGQANCMGEISEFVVRSLEMLSRMNVVNLSNALDTLDGSKHILGVSMLLTAILKQANNISDFDLVFTRVSVFIAESTREQIRWAEGPFAEMCHLFTDELIRRHRPMLGILPIKTAIQRLQRNPNYITSLHSDLCKLCLLSKNFSPALELIRSPEIHEGIALDSLTETADTKGILLFFYYGGMVLTAVKDYSEALFFFEVCVTVPSSAVSHIMLEAYKKYILVSLIHLGHKPKDITALPKYTSTVVNKYFRQLTGPYNELVVAFHSNKSEELKACVTRHAEVFANDQNTGLVNQVVTAQTKTNILRLTKTFLTLSLEELAARVNIESSKEAEKLLVQMIQEGRIHAMISQKDGMVRFDSHPTGQFNTAPVLDMIEANLNRCIMLDSKVTALEEEIMLNPSFVRKSAAANVGSGTSASNTGIAGTAEDEALSLQQHQPRMSNGMPTASASSSTSASNGAGMSMF